MRLQLTAYAQEDLTYWRKADPVLCDRIEALLRQLADDNALPRGQITPLALQYAHLLSVKITADHRLVCERRGTDLIVHQCRYHY